ncbi:MAG TPA: nucleotidyltransferase [Nitrospira sp.]|nr:nucleotidyltransferase [Nitrospira sp.]
MQSNGDDPAHRVYSEALDHLRRSGVPFLVGGAFALERYTGLVRRTKDLDIFVRQADRFVLMDRLAEAGFQTEWRFSHWLGKAWKDQYSIDVIFNSGNGLCVVDDLWFRHAVPSNVLGVDVLLVPPEEMLWSKAFVMERTRYDGGDVAHLLRAGAHAMDWARLLQRFNRHWRVLFSHVILFGYIYPAQRLRIPHWFMNEMVRRLELDMESLPSDRRVCQGTLLSWSQYLIHLERGDYEDARERPRGSLTSEETRYMTDVLLHEQEQQS